MFAVSIKCRMLKQFVYFPNILAKAATTDCGAGGGGIAPHHHHPLLSCAYDNRISTKSNFNNQLAMLHTAAKLQRANSVVHVVT